MAETHAPAESDQAGEHYKQQRGHAKPQPAAHEILLFIPRHALQLRACEIGRQAHDRSCGISNRENTNLIVFDLPKVLANGLPFSRVPAKVFPGVHGQYAVLVNTRDTLAERITNGEFRAVRAPR